MDEEQWLRLKTTDLSNINAIEELNILNRLKCGQTFIKFKSNGHSYSRIYYLDIFENAIHYSGSSHKFKHKSCKIKNIDQIRSGFTTAVWKKCLDKRKISPEKSNLAFSILFRNNRYSLDLLAETEHICTQWIESLEYLINRYRSHVRTYHEITDRWIWFLFSHADRDQSGSLSRREVHRLLFTLNIKLNEDEIDKYFKLANIRTNNEDELTHLDKDEFLILYRLVSYRPELLKIICRFNGSTPEQIAGMLSDNTTINNLPYSIPVEHPYDMSSISFQKSRKKSILSRCHRHHQEKLPSVLLENSSSSLSSDITAKKNCLTTEQLKDFLQNEQHMKRISVEDSSKLIDRFEPSDDTRIYKELSIDGFRLLLLHDEFCILNTDKTQRVYHDMTRPITDYFIATSHNTYIRDNQVYGSCTYETFIHALLTGCRAVEMDCYDGDNMEPIVYHGKTLTRPITFRETILAIETQAFEISPYPLFLNIENHCSYGQQGVMACHLKEIFKDHLLSKPLVDDFQSLPSPEELKYKVIVRSRRYPKGKIPADPKSNQSSDETEPNPKDYHPDFASLIIYSEIVSFTNINHTISTQKCFHSISFKESKVDHLINMHAPEHLDLIKLTKPNLVRVYPNNKRQNSSNVHPVNYWTYGVQMVALNHQANDEAMWLHHGFFSDNGGCGYLLKPSYLLSNDETFDPKEKVHENVKYLQIHIISAQHLPKKTDSIENIDIADPYVEVVTHGIQCDNTKHRTPSVRNNGLNPIWDYKINLDIYCPELCLILFKVRDKDRFTRSALLGQACIPFTALQLGYRHIKLRAKDGDYIHGTLFVHIKIE
ncbi:unnamed protein product [Adineta steineri]|uniref:Phosphoinositide phospholipase C n=1 Tax=Adineta steineri TaxID=433720 RepID=A0A815CJQ2_9BILA|nr:unnamed protein product [Adineta steineri]CAF3521733.1 unnamed protein product [Adineta steineri]